MSDDVPYLVMDWLEGCDLLTRIRRQPLDEAQTLFIANKLCSALASAHELGIIHRDLKPGNVFLIDDDPERPCIIDLAWFASPPCPSP